MKNLIASLTHYLVDEINAKFKAEKPSNTGAELSVTFILDDGITSALTNNVNESYTLKINISDPQVRNCPTISTMKPAIKPFKNRENILN